MSGHSDMFLTFSHVFYELSATMLWGRLERLLCPLYIPYFIEFLQQTCKVSIISSTLQIRNLKLNKRLSNHCTVKKKKLKVISVWFQTSAFNHHTVWIHHKSTTLPLDKWAPPGRQKVGVLAHFSDDNFYAFGVEYSCHTPTTHSFFSLEILTERSWQ